MTPDISSVERTATRIALGSAQFGQRYGVANSLDKTAPDEVGRILQAARAAGVDTIDTAAEYGDAEEVLGTIGVGGWRVISKIPAVPDGCTDVDGWVESAVERSLRRLRIERLDGLLLHRPDQLLTSVGEQIHRGLQRVKTSGLVRRIGLSVYDPGQLAELWPRYDIDMIQTPFNVVDQRLVRSGTLARLVAADVDVDVRSVFLQGLLLMPRAQRPAEFHAFDDLWTTWESWLDTNRLSALEASLGFALQQEGVNQIIVGVESLGQLDELLLAARARWSALPPQLSREDALLIDPRRWKSS